MLKKSELLLSAWSSFEGDPSLGKGGHELRAMGPDADHAASSPGEGV